MTATTIKVSSELRDRLKHEASERGHTLAELLEALLEEDGRRRRLARLREQIALTPPDDDYRREAEEWQGGAW